MLVNNYANITAAAGDGIRAGNYGVGNVTVNDGTWNDVSGGQGTTIDTSTAAGQYGIDAFNYFAGNILVSMLPGDSIVSNSSGIVAVNNGTVTASAGNTIIVDAYGTIQSGATSDTSGSRPAGILGGYNGADTGSTPNANVFGDVLINNYANITAGQTGAPTNADGIRAFNYGVGNVTVIDGTLNNVANGPGTVITDTYNGIDAYTYNSGNILVSMVPGDSILSGGSGMNIGNDAIIIDQSAHSVITINAYGAINSGSATTGSRPAGIQAGYNASASGSTPDANVYGDVFINNYANITAGGGDGIRAFNYGVGNVTVADGTLNDTGGQGTTISAPGQYGIDAFNYFAGDILVSMASGDSITSGGTGIAATSEGNSDPFGSTITVDAAGTITSGSVVNTNGKTPGGIEAGYYANTGTANLNVNGNVVVNNSAIINCGCRLGHRRLQLWQWKRHCKRLCKCDRCAIRNFSISEWRWHGRPKRDGSAGAVITGTSSYGVQAFSAGTGNINVTSGGTINSGSSGITAHNSAAATSAANTITVTAYGTINSGPNLNNGGGQPAGINAGYYGPSSVAEPSVFGAVIINDGANVTAAAGKGLQGVDYASGNITINVWADETIQDPELGAITLGTTTVTGVQNGIQAKQLSTGSGNIAISIDAGATVAGNNGVFAQLTAPGTVGINNSGTITSTTGTAGQAIELSLTTGDTATIDNYGTVIGYVTLANATFDNHNTAVWDVTGSNTFAGTDTIINDGTINVQGSSSFTTTGTLNVTGAGSFTIANGATLEFGGSVAATQTVIFTATTTTETLKIDHSLTAPFSGEISGLTGSPNDAIDLADLTYNVATTTVHYTTLTSTSGTLTVNDGSGHIENFNLINYTGTGNFTASSDSTHGGTGGTWIVDPPISDTSPSATSSTGSAADTVAIDTIGSGSNDATGLTDSQQMATTNDSGTAQDAADGTLASMSSSDLFTVTPAHNNYVGTLTESDNNGAFDWHFNAPNSGLIQLADQTQVYSAQDQTSPAANQSLSVSVGANDQFQFQINAGSGAHAMVNFSAATDQNGAYIGETIDLANFADSEGNQLTTSDILADLTTDSHGNAVVNLGHGDSVTFEHIAQSIVSSQAAHIFITHANVV